ncbi:unnamed protein product, partial [Closterium sp. NIES-53]
MALRITQALHSYALAGRTVVAIMKQPSSKMFSLFTHLLLIITHGNPIFFPLPAPHAALPAPSSSYPLSRSPPLFPSAVRLDGAMALRITRALDSYALAVFNLPPPLPPGSPATSLDGAMALRITRALHSYALAGRSVVATMKQPSSKMFSLFTHLLLITDGNPIFFGAADAALPYFDSIGYIMAPDTSAAEFFL